MKNEAQVRKVFLSLAALAFCISNCYAGCPRLADIEDLKITFLSEKYEGRRLEVFECNTKLLVRHAPKNPYGDSREAKEALQRDEQENIRRGGKDYYCSGMRQYDTEALPHVYIYANNCTVGELRVYNTLADLKIGGLLFPKGSNGVTFRLYKDKSGNIVARMSNTMTQEENNDLVVQLSGIPLNEALSIKGGLQGRGEFTLSHKYIKPK